MREPLSRGEHGWTPSLPSSSPSGLLDRIFLRLPTARLRVELTHDDDAVWVIDRRSARVAQDHRDARHRRRCPADRRRTSSSPGPISRSSRRRSRSGTSTERRSPVKGVHRQLPDTVSADWQRGRGRGQPPAQADERALVFAHELRVDVHDVSLVVSPLTTPPAPLEVPFALERGQVTLRGRAEAPRRGHSRCRASGTRAPHPRDAPRSRGPSRSPPTPS